MTEYVVFKKVPREEASSTDQWEYLGQQGARSSASAIRSYLDGSASQEGEFFAVPARSWKPVTVKVETKTALKFS